MKLNKFKRNFYNRTTQYPVLKWLYNNNIFSLRFIKGKFELSEACDGYFSTMLNKKNVLRLQKEIGEFVKNELK